MLKKILKISGIALGLLTLVALLLPFVFKGKIIRAVKNYAQSALLAKVDFNDDVQISLFRSFPSLSIGISDVRISGVDSFAQDTLLKADRVSLSVNVMSLFGSGPVEISKVTLNKPGIHLKVLESGRANWDITKPDTAVKPIDTTASNFKLALQELSLKDATLEYDDRSLGMNLLLKQLQHELSGDFTADRFTLHTATQIPDFNLSYGGISWLSHVNTDLKADLDMDMKAMRFSFKQGNLVLNALNLGAEGFVDLNDANMEMDLRVKALQQDFKSFISILPGMYQPSFKNMQAAGKLECAVFVKGIYSESNMPAFQAKLNIQDGSFRYPDLPHGAEQIQLALLVDNPDGIADHTQIDLSKFHAVLAGKPLDASLQVKTPVSDPELKASLRGDLDLGRFAGLIPLEAGTKLSGLVHADIRAAGRYSAIEAGRYEDFLAEGGIGLNQILYSYGSGQPAMQLQSAQLDFTPKQVNMPVCVGTYGQSDFNLTGSLRDFIAYALGKSTLQGTLDCNSKLLNINEFMSTSAPATPAATDTLPLEAIVLPRDLTMAIAMKVDKLIYDNLTLEAVKGNARLEDGKLDLSGLSAGLLGGTIALDGAYDSRNSDNPTAGLNIRATSISIPESFRYFPIIQKFAPVARYAKGLFSADVSFNSVFNHLLKPNYQTVDVKGVVRISQA
ncbi:MAG: AsmA family protein, partial [Bacteroidetes bacterium]|nr:AsmA family protein [Bacteroidota bacterium]